MKICSFGPKIFALRFVLIPGSLTKSNLSSILGYFRTFNGPCGSNSKSLSLLLSCSMLSLRVSVLTFIIFSGGTGFFYWISFGITLSISNSMANFFNNFCVFAVLFSLLMNIDLCVGPILPIGEARTLSQSCLLWFSSILYYFGLFLAAKTWPLGIFISLTCYPYPMICFFPSTNNFLMSLSNYSFSLMSRFSALVSSLMTSTSVSIFEGKDYYCCVLNAFKVFLLSRIFFYLIKFCLKIILF